jgi:hypothetical protein
MSSINAASQEDVAEFFGSITAAVEVSNSNNMQETKKLCFKML